MRACRGSLLKAATVRYSAPQAWKKHGKKLRTRLVSHVRMHGIYRSHNSFEFEIMVTSGVRCSVLTRERVLERVVGYTAVKTGLQLCGSVAKGSGAHAFVTRGPVGRHVRKFSSGQAASSLMSSCTGSCGCCVEDDI